MQTNLRKNQDGNALIIALMVVAIVGVMTVIMSESMNFRTNATAMMNMDVERQALANHFADIVDCDETLIQSQCYKLSKTTAVDVYRRNLDQSMSIVIPSDGSANVWGNMMVKAVCDPSDVSVSLVGTRLKGIAKGNASGMSKTALQSAFTSKNADDFLPETYNNKALTWDDPEAVLAQICPSQNDFNPDRIICKSWPASDPTNFNYIYFNYSSDYQSNANNLLNWTLVYQGPFNNDVQRISYRKQNKQSGQSLSDAGALMGYYVPALPCDKYCAIPAGGKINITTPTGAMIMECPSALSIDGRGVLE